MFIPDGQWIYSPAQVVCPITRTDNRPQFLDLDDRTGRYYGPGWEPPNATLPPEEPQKLVESAAPKALPPTNPMAESFQKQKAGSLAAASTEASSGQAEETFEKHCVRCKKGLTKDSKFCAFCGHKCDVKECVRCKCELTADSIFCHNCGHKCDNLLFPDAHQMYDYGLRTIQFSRCVPVPEWNHGVMINAEFVPRKSNLHKEGDLYNRNDDAIRNRSWYHTGSLLERAEDHGVTMDQWLHQHADYKKSFDILGVTRIPDPTKPVHRGYRPQEPKPAVFHDVLERKSFTPEQLQEHMYQRQQEQYKALLKNGRV